MAYTLMQDVARNTTQKLEVIPEEKTLSIMDLIFNGGLAGQIIIGLLFFLLFIAIYLYFERIFAIKSASKMDRNFMDQIRDHVSKGNIQAAKILCLQQNSPVSRLT